MKQRDVFLESEGDAWFEWNLARAKAREALTAAGIPMLSAAELRSMEAGRAGRPPGAALSAPRPIDLSAETPLRPAGQTP